MDLQFIRRLNKRLTENIDGPLLAITLFIMGFGLATIYSATVYASDRTAAQLMNLGAGLCTMWLAAQLPPQKMMRFALPLYLIGVLLLLLVFPFGIKVNGARRWLSLGFTRIQPSEILKIAMPLMLAWYFHKYEAVLKIRHYAVAGLLLAVPFAPIAKQPDLGTAILVGAAGFYVIFFAGLPWKIIIGMVAAGAATTPFVWSMLHDYQRKRILTLIVTFSNGRSDSVTRMPSAAVAAVSSSPRILARRRSISGCTAVMSITRGSRSFGRSET